MAGRFREAVCQRCVRHAVEVAVLIFLKTVKGIPAADVTRPCIRYQSFELEIRMSGLENGEN